MDKTVPGPDLPPPRNGNYDQVFTTEEGALEAARERSDHARATPEARKGNSPFLNVPGKEDGSAGTDHANGTNGHEATENGAKDDGVSGDVSSDDENNNGAEVPMARSASAKSGKSAKHSKSPKSSKSSKSSKSAKTSSGSHSDDSPPPEEISESRSYRTGGIVESVVNVQGVHKTIIEDISEEEPSDIDISSFSSSSRRSRKRWGSDEESQRLMNF
ncbi:hypothetical protein A9F13_05g03421 [Clavispora lusitaniae]|uniref:Uncharacterized protein n=1 Tax=Clavispora lusitaniae TaxID=36911 RepID=A0AA91T2X8_CLALS|nr:hypothetical protein A9F13_05g03421 [Clavispora lusitaniae]